MKSTAIILSGGKGIRLGGNIPKQYIEILGKPVLSYTLTAFQESSVDHVIIVAADEYLEHCREIARECGCSKLLAVTAGGAERYDSVLNGLRRIEEAGIALIHDGARPFITPETINRIIEETKVHGGVIAATPCTDTIKIIDETGSIVSTTDRKLTWAAQTPQSFYSESITKAYEMVIGNKGNDKENSLYKGVSITDDAMVYQLAFPDRQVKVIDAGRENIKITTASDLAIAENIIRQRKNSDLSK